MTIVLLALLSAVFVLLGTAKVAAVSPMPAKAAHLGFTVDQYRGIGALELAGVAGLLLGRLWHPLTAISGIGLIILLLGAAWAHISHHDSPREVVVPLAVAGLVGLYLAVSL